MCKKFTLCSGSELKLDTYETQFNEGLMAKKHQELDSAFYTSNFPPAKYFYQGKKNQTKRILYRGHGVGWAGCAFAHPNF